MTTNLLWADDDCERSLVALGRLIERRNRFLLHTATSYSDANDILFRQAKIGHARIQSLLVDIILPHGGTSGSLATHLGLRLAEKAVGLGVKSVAFLTVVRVDEVLDKYRDLQLRHSSVKWSFFDKVALLEQGELDKLINRLCMSTGDSSAARV